MSRKIDLNVEIVCAVNDEYFRDWNELTDEQKEFWHSNSCDCGGSGVMGVWCADCPLCKSFEVET